MVRWSTKPIDRKLDDINLITAPKPEATAAAKPTDELFSTMEQQYEVARQVTHISRGVGLGFGSRPF